MLEKFRANVLKCVDGTLICYLEDVIEWYLMWYCF